jgi:hypothetical protein
MSEYLLPCSCGRKVPVSTRHAGQTVRCACGAELEVPTLRGLRELEPAGAAAAPARGTWENRQRIAFLLAVASLLAIGVAGYLAWRLPPKIEPPQPIEIDQNSSIGMVFMAYDDLKRGLDIAPPELNLYERQAVYHRDMLSWGIRIALVLGGIGAVATVVALLSGKSQKR